MTVTPVRARAVAGLLGFAVIIIGTFAPWLASGKTTRNLYSAAGVGHRLFGLGGVAGAAVDLLPLLSLLYLMVALLWSAGWVRVGAGLGVVLDLMVTLASVAALRAPRSGPVHVLGTGPYLTLLGAVLNFAAILPVIVMPGRAAAISTYDEHTAVSQLDESKDAS